MNVQRIGWVINQILVLFSLHVYSQIVFSKKYSFDNSIIKPDLMPFVDNGFYLFKRDSSYVSYSSSGCLSTYVRGYWRIKNDTLYFEEVEIRSDTNWKYPTVKGENYVGKMLISGGVLHRIYSYNLKIQNNGFKPPMIQYKLK
jgi:hypothetical protein